MYLLALPTSQKKSNANLMLMLIPVPMLSTAQIGAIQAFGPKKPRHIALQQSDVVLKSKLE
jgi:hypothetical protein